VTDLSVGASAAAVLVPVVVAIFWFARLEGRVNTQEKRHEDLTDDVKYIRDRIDRALNGNGKH
jgi:hypothetical protein